jgi:hypothetical protein
MSKELIEQLAKEHGAIFTDWQNAREPEIAFYGGTTQLEAFATHRHRGRVYLMDGS